MCTTYEQKFKELQDNPDFIEKISKAKIATEFIDIYKEYGIELSQEEADGIVRAIESNSALDEREELTMEEMDQVSGGFMIAGVVIPGIIWKTALALVAACGVVAGIKKLKKQFAQYF